MRRGFSSLLRRLGGLFAQRFLPWYTHREACTGCIPPVTHTQGGIYRVYTTYKHTQGGIYRVYTSLYTPREAYTGLTLLYIHPGRYIPGLYPYIHQGGIYPGYPSLYTPGRHIPGVIHPFHCW